jgi:hypothetical protein
MPTNIATSTISILTPLFVRAANHCSNHFSIFRSYNFKSSNAENKINHQRYIDSLIRLESSAYETVKSNRGTPPIQFDYPIHRASEVHALFVAAINSGN